MKSKKVFFTEAAYIIGIIALAFGTALMEKADFGVSMIVAPAYLLHLKLSQSFPWFSFGVSEYIFQAFLLLVISFIMGGFKKRYLFSFFTAVLYGSILDLFLSSLALISVCGIAARILCFILGMVFCAVGVAMLFHTYISPEAYELFVKEIAQRWNKDISKVKTLYDCCSCLVGILFSFAFFGLWQFEGVKLGTVICALFNGWLIGKCSDAMDCHFDFKDGLRLRPFFETE